MARYQKARTELSPSSSSLFLQRALVTFTLGPLALLLIYLGGWFYFVPLVLFIGLASVEYSRLLGHLGGRVPLAILLPAVLLQLLAAEWPEFGLFAPALAASLVAAALYALWLYETDAQGQPVTDEVGRQGKAKMAVTAEWAMMVAGILILGWMGGHFFLLRQLPQHAASWTILVMVSTWVADSAAYVFGTRFGRRQLARRLSPKKTVEGYLAGVVVGTAVTVGLAFFMGRAWPVALLLGLLISVASPGGDLAISLLKREAGVKDSGKMLPGHGGALDRIDSLLWSVTLSYYVIVLLT